MVNGITLILLYNFKEAFIREVCLTPSSYFYGGRSLEKDVCQKVGVYFILEFRNYRVKGLANGSNDGSL